ncbi:hypothetical protein MOLA814_00691 [Betaproteobacteria bacterium MOLA814]|nr:hypothetical protein MOLA814_00691 [Betaproteobacteria bacterium MOLA814]
MTQNAPEAKNGFAHEEVSQMSPLLFISYFTGIRGNCPAEWADDKIRVLGAAGRKTIVLTGMGSHVQDSDSVSYVRVPSLSWIDYREEIKELKSGGEDVPFGIYLLMPLAFSLGSLIDYILRKVTKGISSGRWPWLLTALPVALWYKLRYRVRDVFCTGGPTSAQVVGGITTWLAGGRLFCEYQDPLLGAMMTRSGMTRRISARIETWLARRSTKAVYVTQEAARLARERNPDHSSNIVSVYPGAWQFVPPVSRSERRHGVFEFLHLGTLYGSRNLDLFFSAIDALREEGFEPARTVRVVNLGAVYCETASQYQARADFQLLDALDRVDALQRARNASCLMLVQHTDERSRETIPYKTYDYLNLGLPVLGLLNNDELRSLIELNGGYTAQADQLYSIKRALRSCLTALADSRSEIANVRDSLDISVQFLQVLECADVGH